MYKSQLQELCNRRNWKILPKYSIVKDGPEHLPRFTATVNVDGHVFHSPAFCSSSKEAQNSAAQIAFDYFNTPPPQLASPAASTAVNSTASEAAPVPSPPAVDPSALTALAEKSIDASVSVAPSIAIDPPPPEFPAVALIAPPASVVAVAPAPEFPAVVSTAPTAPVVMIAPSPELLAVDPVAHHDIPHIYKNQLQQYTCRENIGFPVYTTEFEGPSHNRRFKSTVFVGGKSYQTSEFSPTLKEAEQVAARVACQSLSINTTQEDLGLYKNLLQQIAQKKGLVVPSYETTSSGLPHNRLFVSIVEIGEHTFQGAEAKTKKQAEMFAAKVAYCTLAKGSVATKSSQVSCMDECLAAADNLIQNIQPTATTIKYEDTRNEDDYSLAKRARPSTESMNMHSPSLSNTPTVSPNVIQVENGCTVPADRVGAPMHVVEPSLQCTFKTVVFPRKSGCPIPEGATMMPYSDDQWVAYKIDENQAPTA